MPTLPVADTRPCIPPCVIGLPVTQAKEFSDPAPNTHSITHGNVNTNKHHRNWVRSVLEQVGSSRLYLWWVEQQRPTSCLIPIIMHNKINTYKSTAMQKERPVQYWRRGFKRYETMQVTVQQIAYFKSKVITTRKTSCETDAARKSHNAIKELSWKHKSYH